MRRASRLDANQKLIVANLRKLGASVQSLAAVGDGCPDILVGWQGKNYLIEIKDGSKKPSAQALTLDQAQWISGWQGEVAVCRNLGQVLDVLGVQMG